MRRNATQNVMSYILSNKHSRTFTSTQRQTALFSEWSIYQNYSKMNVYKIIDEMF